MKRISFLLAILMLPIVLFAQAPVSFTSAEMFQGLSKLKVLGSVLYIAAHPDDENTRLITWLSKDKLYRTGYLSLTRGDGGQNLIGNDQGIDLGLIRTQELLSARRIDGGEQFFSRAYDFGFSQGPEETFTKWDREKILSDVVWVIRKFQPDVIITRFPTTGEGGHGHHTASAILANEAFTAAADASRFPEQLKYVQPWKARRILFNSFNFSGVNTTDNSQLKVDVGGYNPLLGKSYGEIAAESRSQHKSQGFGVASSRGESIESFKTTGGDAPIADLMDGINCSWQRVAGAEKIAGMIDELIQRFNVMKPEASVQGLVALYAAIKGLPDGYWKKKKLEETQQLIAQCSGLFIDATTNTQFAVQRDSVRVSFVVNNRLGTDAILRRIALAGAFDSTVSRRLEKNKNLFYSAMIGVPPSKEVTQPYWLANKMEEGYYNVSDQQLIGMPDVQPAYVASFEIELYGQRFSFEQKVQYKFTDPVKGELYEPLVILPPVELRFVNENNFSINDSEAVAQVNFRTNLPDSASYDFNYHYSDHWNATHTSFKYGSYKNPSNYSSAQFVPRQKGLNAKEEVTLDARARDNHLYNQYRVTIHYDHIPYIVYFKEARAHLVSINYKTYGKRIGYIPGAGDKVMQALDQMGYEVVVLTDKELARTNLAQFDAIITGVRAYNTDEWLNGYYDKLMAYVNDGGNLIVQYNTSNNIGPVRARIGPYNFNISRTRVTDENASVTFTRPDHPVLNFPNKITQDDFKGWIQERSIYHGSDWDPKLESVFSMHDPGEKADEGSLLIGKYGKGYFTYTGIVFYRELPAGVPGAYRLLANLIALNKKKAF